jgi:DNA-binding response OmpR family regulator
MSEMASGKPVTVLVAEDEPDLRDLIAYRLNRSGYHTLTASNGEDALRLAEATTPDLAVVDAMMPKMDGYELTRALRGVPATQRMPIIMLTARVQETDVSHGFQSGVDDYMRKPFNPDELVARINAVLAMRSRWAEAQS